MVTTPERLAMVRGLPDDPKHLGDEWFIEHGGLDRAMRMHVKFHSFADIRRSADIFEELARALRRAVAENQRPKHALSDARAAVLYASGLLKNLSSSSG